MPPFHQMRNVATVLFAAAGLNAGAKERIAWCKDVEVNHNKTADPFPYKYAPSTKLPDEYKALFN
ncbi:hypothetical protein DIPPA_23340 [Diplonema papillatum]|nr:hypothetical protein DIPPA_23340 [Diplonema papillatum]